jgi:hypothetical protein
MKAWRYLKDVELQNQTVMTISRLETAVNAALQQIRRLPKIVRATFREAGLIL